MKEADNYIDSLKHLPPEPRVLLQLLDLFDEPDRDIDRIVQLIRHDPSLTTEILRVCNTGYFSPANPVDDVFEAVNRLGFSEICCTVTTIFGSQAFSVAGQDAVLDPSELWRHAVATAVAASALARKLGENTGPAFTAALLHDVGKIILAGATGETYAEVVQEAQADHQSLVDAERRRLGVDHAAISGRVLARWQFPSNLVNSVSFHHEPAQAAPFERLAACVRLSNVVAHFMGYGLTSQLDDFQRGAECMTSLGLTPDIMPSLVMQTTDGLLRMKDMLSLRRSLLRAGQS